MTLSKNTLFTLVTYLATCHTNALYAQYNFQSDWILAEEGQAVQGFVGATMITGISSRFSNLGEMPYIQYSYDDGETSNFTYEFNDGYINFPSEDSDYTTDFGFLFQNAVEGDDGYVESFRLSRYRSQNRGEYRDVSFDNVIGWEMGGRFDRWRLSNRTTLGFVAAAGFIPLSETIETSVYGDLYVQEVDVTLQGPGLEYQETGSYTGSAYGGPKLSLTDLGFDESIESLVSQELADGSILIADAEIEGIYRLAGGVGMFRTGTYLDIYLTDNLLLHAGLGFSLSYLSYDFTVDQSLVSSTLSTDYQLTDNINDGQWIWGAYGELNLVYKLNAKTSLYVGAQKHFTLTDVESRDVDGVSFQVEFSSPTIFQTGFEFNF